MRGIGLGHNRVPIANGRSRKRKYDLFTYIERTRQILTWKPNLGKNPQENTDSKQCTMRWEVQSETWRKQPLPLCLRQQPLALCLRPVLLCVDLSQNKVFIFYHFLDPVISPLDVFALPLHGDFRSFPTPFRGPSSPSSSARRGTANQAHPRIAATCRD